MKREGWRRTISNGSQRRCGVWNSHRAYCSQSIIRSHTQLHTHSLAFAVSNGSPHTHTLTFLESGTRPCSAWPPPLTPTEVLASLGALEDHFGSAMLRSAAVTMSLVWIAVGFGFLLATEFQVGCSRQWLNLDRAQFRKVQLYT